MKQLILQEVLRNPEEDSILRNIAQAGTLIVLHSMNADKKRGAFLFLLETTHTLTS
jgi:hypothetical protein